MCDVPCSIAPVPATIITAAQPGTTSPFHRPRRPRPSKGWIVRALFWMSIVVASQRLVRPGLEIAHDTSVQAASETQHVPSAAAAAAAAATSWPGIVHTAVVNAAKAPTRRSCRLFLGIFSARLADARTRNVIRKTYLSLDSKYAPFARMPTICSLQYFERHLPVLPVLLGVTNSTNSTNSTDKKGTNGWCQIVYAFVLDGGPKPKDQTEPDILYLEMTKNGDDKPNRVLGLYQYLGNHTNLMNLRGRQGKGSNYDRPSAAIEYVAYTDCHTVLYPTRLWPQDLFWTQKYTTTRVYSGNPSRNISDSMVVMEGYVMLSIDLVLDVLQHPVTERCLPTADTERIIATIISSLNPPVSVVSIPNSVHIVAQNKFVYLSFVDAWDDYKDGWVTYEDPQEESFVRSNPRTNHTLGLSRHGPRVLLGIFSMDSQKERKRRKAVRETYLSYFKQSQAGNERRRICSLKVLIQSIDQTMWQDCQLAYIFVIGGNPSGSTELVNPNAAVPMTVQPPPDDSNEDDIVYLNIRENMKTGKSQTFAKYATTVIDEHMYFDYVAKTDSDTLLFPRALLVENFNRLPRFPNNVRVYGGSPRVKQEFEQLKGPTYNQGLLYWMSVDLVRYITSPACDREGLKVFSEDKSIGNFVHSHQLPIRRVKLAVEPRSFVHPLKHIPDYRDRWNAYQSNDVVEGFSHIGID